MATQAATGRPHLRLLTSSSVDVQARLAQAINEGRHSDARVLLERYRQALRRRLA